MRELLLIPDITMRTPVYFSPYALAVGARERGCLTCEHFHGEFSAERAA